MILQTNLYPVLYKNLDLHITNSINDYQPISVVNDSLRYDSRYCPTCTYEFDSMLRLTSITPVNNVTTSYTWDGIYPVSKTVGNQTSTFSYIPYVGMSSMTDARGVTTYYAYDTYGRLIEVYRQHNTHGKEILNHYIYHIKTE
jgi:YD repeat-containing protein